MKRFAIPFVAAVSLTFAVAWTMAFRQVRRPTLPPSPPPSAVAPQTVAGIGLVEPESENIALSCSVSGMVTGVYVKAGDRVQAGQRLFSLDDRDLQADLRVKRAVREADVQRRRLAYKASQARLAETEAQLALLKAGAWAPDIAAAKSEVARA